MSDFAAVPASDLVNATASAARRCLACGYDLRGLEQHRCPECGLEFDPHHLPVADIPWLNRRRHGPTSDNALLAYCKTVWLVLARPKKLGEMVWQDVEVDAAETTRFRWITIGIACGSMLASLLPVIPPVSAALLILILVMGVPFIAFFWMATGKFDIIQFFPARFCQEVRFGRLHDLTCAGLAFMPIVPLFLLLGLIAGWPGSYVGPRAIVLMGVVVITWWYGSMRYQIHGGRCTLADAILHALLLPFAWCMIAMVVMIFSVGLMGLCAQFVMN